MNKQSEKWRFFRSISRVSVFATVILSFTSSSFGYCLYFDLWPSEDGKLYAFAATDTTPDRFGMTHTAGAQVTLTSPSQHSTTASASAQNYIRVDIDIALDESDVGEWVFWTHHDGYCPVMGHFMDVPVYPYPVYIGVSYVTVKKTGQFPVPGGGVTCTGVEDCAPGSAVCQGWPSVGLVYDDTPMSCPPYWRKTFMTVRIDSLDAFCVPLTLIEPLLEWIPCGP